MGIGGTQEDRVKKWRSRYTKRKGHNFWRKTEGCGKIAKITKEEGGGAIAIFLMATRRARGRADGGQAKDSVTNFKKYYFINKHVNCYLFL